MSAPPRTIIRDGQALAALVPRLLEAEAIAVDTETTALSPFDGRMRLLSLGLPDETFLIDAFDVPDLSALARVFNSPKPFKVLHNAKFDQRWLLHHHGLVLAGVFDTMLASQLLGEHHEHSLVAVVGNELGQALDKAQQLSDWSRELSELQLTYAARDVEVLLPLRQVLRKKLLDAGLARVAAIEFGVVGVVAAMENAGVYLDVVGWHAVLAGMKVQHEALSRELQELLLPTRKQLALIPEVAPGINLNSTQQMRSALAELGIDVPDTHEGTLLQVKDRHPIIPKILEYRGLQKAISSYGEGLLAHIHPATGRIHANFQQLVTTTGRFSCSSPNLQNIPATPEYRACFTAPAGFKLVVADYSQIELRILAEISADVAFRRAFEQKLDLHKMTASEMFWVPYDEVTKQQRNQAKGINFGLVYGRGAPSLADQLGVTVEKARELIARYFETYKGVATWLERTGRAAVRERELRSIAGRRAIFRFDEHDRGAVAAVERQGKNFPIQATNSDIIKKAMTMLPPVLAPLGARLVNCVHDELVVEAPTERADEAAELVRATMVAAAADFLREVPVDVEVAVADAWLK
ncbi:MAG: DNA-directed polymerase [Cyanobacteria bacterium RYN_339]|nr:DNA-directed polymerase [Cyanobacteria bacterium RYN_339]